MAKPGPLAGPQRRALLYACFVASGAAGLMLEVVWSKYLSILLGNSIYGVSTVVAAFLGGLGIGAMAGGRLSSRAREPLLVYARLEALIGLLAAASPAAFLAARPLFAWINGALEGQGVVFWTVRFVVLFGALLAPTLAMGATLPLLISDFDRRGAAFASSVGRLYAFNTLGAVAGVLAAGFVLIPSLGLWKSALCAALIDMGVAAAVALGRPAAPPAPAAGPATDRGRDARHATALARDSSRSTAPGRDPGRATALGPAAGPATAPDYDARRATALARDSSRSTAPGRDPGQATALGPAAGPASDPRRDARHATAAGRDAGSAERPRERRGDRSDERVALSRQPAQPRGALLLSRLIVPLFALSGFTAILYEIAWTRILTIPFGGMVYAFTTILALYLLGIAAGAALASRLLRTIVSPVVLFGILEVALAAAVIGGERLFTRLQHLQLSVIMSAEGSALRFFGGEAGIAALVVVAPTLILGALFPAAAAIYRQGPRASGESVGAIYAANTAGSIAGSLLTGFLLIPWIGSLESIRVGGVINLVIAIAVIVLGGEWGRAGRLAAIGAVAVAGALLVLARPEWDVRTMNVGFTRLLRAYRLGGETFARDLLSSRSEVGSKETVLFSREGRLASVAVVETEKRRVLLVNGKPDATTGAGGDMMTQVMVGQLPMIVFRGGAKAPIARGPEAVCVVGYGSGVTTHAVLSHPVHEALTVELEEAVIEAAPYFHDAALDPLADPRSRLVIEDAGSFLRSTSRRFDVIVSQPTNPWIAGVGDLFTREFYDAAAARLTPGGIFCQWIQVYEISPATLGTVFRTLRSRFPSGHVFYAGPSNDLVIVASTEPNLPLDPDRIRAALAQESVARDLARVGVSSPSDLLDYYLGRLETLARAAGEGPINTDDNGWLEHRAPLDLLVRQEHPSPFPNPGETAADLAASLGPSPAASASLVVQAVERAAATADPTTAARLRLALERLPGPEAEAVKPRAVELEKRSENAEKARRLLKEALPLLSRAVKESDRAGIEKVVAMLTEAASLEPDNGEIAARLGSTLISAWRAEEAVPVLQRALGLVPEPRKAKVHRDLAVADFFLKRFDDCLRELEELDRLEKGTADARFWRARVFQERGEADRARAEIEEGLRENPKDARLASLLKAAGH